MGLSGFFNLEGEDIAAFVVASLVGYFAGTIVPAGTSAIFTSLIVSYHLFLGWLVFGGKHNAGVSLPIAMTCVTHLACLFVIIVPVAAARNTVPFFGVFRYTIVALAIFERGWLFSASTEQPKAAPAQTDPAPMAVADSGADAEAWRQYLAQQTPGSLLRLHGVAQALARRPRPVSVTRRCA